MQAEVDRMKRELEGQTPHKYPTSGKADTNSGASRVIHKRNAFYDGTKRP